MTIANGLQIAVAVLAVLAGLGAAGTWLVLGTARGRLENLENTNKDLRGEIDDERRRRSDVERDLAAAKEASAQDRVTISHLRGEVATMRSIFEAVNGPIADLAAAIRKDHDVLLAHNNESARHAETIIGLLHDSLALAGAARTSDRKDGT